MATTSTIKVKVSVAWWFSLYIYGIVFVSKITGSVPDADKIYKALGKAMKIQMQLNNDNR